MVIKTTIKLGTPLPAIEIKKRTILIVLFFLSFHYLSSFAVDFTNTILSTRAIIYSAIVT